jgi:predicted dithiol-disulfide oxidoreductase (DUF899 family)
MTKTDRKTPRTGSREAWLAARVELLKAEKELTRRGDEVARLRRDLPWVRIDKDYRFDTDEGGASLPCGRMARTRRAGSSCPLAGPST